MPPSCSHLYDGPSWIRFWVHARFRQSDHVPHVHHPGQRRTSLLTFALLLYFRLTMLILNSRRQFGRIVVRTGIVAKAWCSLPTRSNLAQVTSRHSKSARRARTVHQQQRVALDASLLHYRSMWHSLPLSLVFCSVSLHSRAFNERVYDISLFWFLISPIAQVICTGCYGLLRLL
jgi:hypothetical protein